MKLSHLQSLISIKNKINKKIRQKHNKGMKKSMNTISQISIFEYREIENLGDLERLKIFFENIDDDKLCEKLERRRKNGRND